MVTIVPIPKELLALLDKLGYYKYRNTERYLISDEVDGRKTIMNQLSKSFSHYYKLYSPGPDLSFRSLRKSYITEVNMRYGDLANLTTHGRGKDVATNYYFD